MAKVSRIGGSTSHVLTMFIQDSSSTTGAGLTGLAFNTTSLTAYYKRNSGIASVAITLVNIATLGTYVSGGFKEIDATNMPGFYEFHPPDGAYASGAKSVAFMLKGAANMVVKPIEVELTAVDNQDAVKGGISNLDAAISSRSTYAGGAVASVTAAVTLPAIPTDWIAAAGVKADAVTKIQSGLSTFAGGIVAGVTAPVTVGTNNDKTGYALATAPPTAAQVRTEMDANSTKLANLDTTVSSRMATFTLPANFAALGISVGGKINSVVLVDTVTTNTDMRGTDSAYTGTPPTVTEIRTEMDANSAKLANLDAAVSSRSVYAGEAVASVTAPVTVGTVNDKTGYSLTDNERVSVANTIFDHVTEGNATFIQVVRGWTSALLGKVSGLQSGQLPKFRDFNDTKDRIVVTTDDNGNRNNVTLDLN